MPLDRQNVTVASRIMLPTYVAFFLLLGLNYLTSEQVALTNPALSFANDVMPLPIWGGLFVSCSLLMLAALLAKRRTLYRFALRMCGLSMVFWAAVIFWASLDGVATPFAAAWAGFVSVCCLATDRSLAAREV